jgi:carbonic anhydrase
MARDSAASEAEAVLKANSAMRTELEPHQGYRGVQMLLDCNKQWAAEVSRFNPRYFIELAKQQKPEYLWVGCSDSRVSANEVIGLHPSDVFVHCNVGNVFSLSDLNCLSALQFVVDCVKVHYVIVVGHYKCGGATAAMHGGNLGLADHWIVQAADIKSKWWDRATSDVPEEFHLNVLCELNVLAQLSHVVGCRIVQRRWKPQNASDRYYGCTTNAVYVRPEHAIKHLSEKIRNNLPATVVNDKEELEVHGRVYSLDDGMLRPLLSLNRHSNAKKAIGQVIEALFTRYSQMA